MSLTTPAAFFDALRQGLLGPTLSAEEVKGCNAVLSAMEGAPLSWAAYALATAYHETASTMQPIREYGGPTYFTRMYDVTGARPQLAVKNGNTCAGDGPKYCGRGYVQLTWKTNYARAGKECGADLVAYPDKAMEPAIAAKIMRQGMERGWFTGKGFSDYLPRSGHADRTSFTNARRIINGTDRAAQIAEHAIKFQLALDAGGVVLMTFWRQLLTTIAKNPISLFAVLCVACTAAFLGWLTYRLVGVLESPQWCGKAIQAEKITPGEQYIGLTTCVDLLKIQLQAVATGFHISTGGFVFVLIVLIVVVVAGARASGKVGTGGLEFDMSRQDAAAAGAEHVVQGAEKAASEVSP